MNWKLTLIAGFLTIILGTAVLFLVPRPEATSNDYSSAKPAVDTMAAIAPVLLPEPPPAGPKVVEGVISRGTLYDALTSHDIPAAEVFALTTAFKPVFDFSRARPKDIYEVNLDAQYRIQQFVYKTGLTEEYEAVRSKKDRRYTVQKRKIRVDQEVVSRVFTVDTSLYQAVADHAESHKMAKLIADIFAWDIDFYTYPRKGDQIAVVYERECVNGQFVRYGKILAAQYQGPRKTFYAFLFNDGHFSKKDDAFYYDETGRPLKNMFLRAPLKFGRVTSNYSIRRFHPITKLYKAHTGIDYGAPTGTPIQATAMGKVTFAGTKSGYGKLVIIKHPHGEETYYAHCSKLLVKPGQRVTQGQTIAKVGQTGLATGPHVHYEVRLNKKPTDPNNIQKNKAQPLASGPMARFKATIGDRKSLMAKALKEPSYQVAKAAPAEPQAGKAVPAEPQAAKAAPAKPQAARAVPAEPQVAKAVPAEPQAAKAVPAEPEAAKAAPAEPQVANTALVEHQVKATPVERQAAKPPHLEPQVAKPRQVAKAALPVKKVAVEKPEINKVVVAKIRDKVTVIKPQSNKVTETKTRNDKATAPLHLTPKVTKTG
ncbi:M23 family metallopeptidase [Desulfosarcina sp. OttesenSCG-928-A07]|nr:M23 family metallopeptidase [Desulfosarcina sp. OttesenSCG-928-G17]MDL2329224.1 M23 family metallopeptidase [Desulfosarcina sp. OttesenSCG-928-A07]